MSKTLLPLSFVFILPSFVVSIALLLGLDVRGQQILLTFLLLFLLFVLRQLLKKQVRLFHLQTQTVLLFLLTLLIQLLVTSSGGFYSPFLVSVHLITLGVGFFFGMSAAMMFLSGVLCTLVVHLRFDATIVYIFQEDPWTIILYILSFVALVPITHQLVEQYQLKESIARYLNRQLQVNVTRESLILGGLREMVIVLNPNFEILSVNQAVRVTLSTTNQALLFKSVFEKIPLKHVRKGDFTADGIGLQRVLGDKAARTVTGYIFIMPPSGREVPVEVQIRPVINPAGTIEQIVLVIHAVQSSDKDEGSAHQTTYPAFAEAIDHSVMFIQDLADQEDRNAAQATASLVYSLIDANTAFELEDHLIVEHKKLEDIEVLVREIVTKLQSFASIYGTKLVFQQRQDSGVKAQPIVPKGVTLNSNVLRSDMTTDVDRYWMESLCQRLLRLAMLLSIVKKEAHVNVSVDADGSIVVIRVTTGYLGDLSVNDMYELGIGSKQGTPLMQSTGFEGFIMKSIASQTNVNLEFQGDEKGCLMFVVSIPRGPQG